MQLPYNRRSGRILAPVTLLLALLAGVLGQTGNAQAAAVPTASAKPAAATSTPSPAPSRPTAKAPTTAASKAAAARSAASGALKDRIERAGQALDCPASLLPDVVSVCAAAPTQPNTFTVPLSRATDFVTFQVVSTGGNMPFLSLTSPDGTATPCVRATGDGIQCTTGQPGAYILSVRIPDAGADFSIAYLPLLADTTCTPVSSSDLSLGAPQAFTLTQPAGSAGVCRTLSAAAGDVLRMHVTDFQVGFSVFDATGKSVCATDGSSVSDLDCTLTGAAPYRELEYQWYGSADTYTFTASKLNSPTGCPVLQPQAYGTVPDVTSTARCRILHVPTAGLYEYGTAGNSVDGSLYTSQGASACTPILLTPCQLAAGDYTWALTGRATSNAFGMWFIATASSAGCTATPATGFSTGPTTGTFTGAGQQLCLTVPAATGTGLYLVQEPTGDQSAVAADVYDAVGARQCQVDDSVTVCKLTGTAPFHIVVSGPATGAFGLILQHTGDGTGCTAWPQSAFGGSWGATVSLTGDTNIGCLSIPANQHSTAEMLDYSNLANRVNANVRLVDAAGNVACQTLGSSTTDCKLTAGRPYTAILQAVNISADTYHLVRRDISSTATCAAPANTKVGGPSASFTLNSDLDSHCFKIAAKATDKFWLGARANSSGNAGTLLQVVDGSGTTLCWQYGVSCRVTGATSYTVIVVASGYAGSAINAHVDTWLVGTAAGWVPECTANPLSAKGFPVHSGTFTESSTGFCGTVQVAPPVSFGVYGTSTAAYPATPWVSLLSSAHWNTPNQYQCGGANYGTFAYNCSVQSTADAGQAVFIVSPANSVSPTEYSFQGVCSGSCTGNPAVSLTSLTPATGPTGTQNQVVLHGTGLNLGTQLTLAQNGVRVGSGIWPVSVSADGTSLHLSLSTIGLAPGSYDLALTSVGYTAGTPSYGYLPGAYTVTAATTPTQGRLIPTAPTRFLDTRYGTGAPKGRVSSQGVVKLQVAGVHGIPRTGVTAVVMNVTAVDPSTGGFVSVYPDGIARPNTSNINFSAHQTLPNLVTVPVVNGTVDLYSSAGKVDLLADVSGYYSSTGATGYALTTTIPTRFLDTRYGTGAPKGRVSSQGVVKLQVAGVHGIPRTGVTAVVMNVTAVDPSTGGFVSVYPDGTSPPKTSNLNLSAHRTVPNLVTVPVVNGKVDLYSSAGKVDLLADVSGYYSAAGSSYSPAGPLRLLDTRDGTGARYGAVGGQSTVTLRVAGIDGIPANATAVLLNVTVTSPTSGSYLTAYPHGTPLPGVSNLNYTAHQTISNLVLVPVVDGTVSFTNNNGNTDVIADVNGYFSS